MPLPVTANCLPPSPPGPGKESLFGPRGHGRGGGRGAFRPIVVRGGRLRGKGGFWDIVWGWMWVGFHVELGVIFWG